MLLQVTKPSFTETYGPTAINGIVFAGVAVFLHNQSKEQIAAVKETTEKQIAAVKETTEKQIAAVKETTEKQIAAQAELAKSETAAVRETTEKQIAAADARLVSALQELKGR